MNAMLDLAQTGIQDLLKKQQIALANKWSKSSSLLAAMLAS
jgi:hypothetical protein